ncbi:MAG: Coenzyme F420 hydrogenase/dehydrogenase, beta subunit C-terminal domain [Lachnospiraceae bacterium]|nr:Coenzyme F420 hydrogenase/dehydrogenase, beta subunit C-terminal domain [Lachnospiraceae bacterium]
MLDVINKEKCSGCYACANKCPQNCIKMKMDKEGFRYPCIDKNKCIDCHLCEKVCPIINQEGIDNNPKAYACINKNEDIRLESSSGGIFSLLAECVIEQGGIVYGAAFNDKYEVEHIGITNIDELYKLRGSKYVQSNIGNVYSEIEKQLEAGQLVYFSGTPCQVGGLLSFLSKSYNNLICQDIVCHGVPSPKIWKQYLEMHNREYNDIPTQINFRQKDAGWSMYELNIKYMNNNSYKCYHRNDVYMKAFLGNMDLRPSCYHCHFKSLNRLSDITLADFWGVDNVVDDMNDNKGTSLVFINSEHGNILFHKIKDEMIYKEVDINKAVVSNPCAYESVQEPKVRKHFFDKIDKVGFDKYIKRVTKDKLILKVKRKIYSILKSR